MRAHTHTSSHIYTSTSTPNACVIAQGEESFFSPSLWCESVVEARPSLAVDEYLRGMMNIVCLPFSFFIYRFFLFYSSPLVKEQSRKPMFLEGSNLWLETNQKEWPWPSNTSKCSGHEREFSDWKSISRLPQSRARWRKPSFSPCPHQRAYSVF